MLRPTYLEVNTKKLYRNIQQIRGVIGKKTGIMAVVKADAYGHGIVDVAKACVNSGVECLCVANVEEGALLRRRHIYSPILILGLSNKREMQVAVKKGLKITVSNPYEIKTVNDIASSLGIEATVHFKADTGMSRVGFRSKEEFAEMIKVANECRYVYSEGLFTHFACADDDDPAYSMKQQELFFDYIDYAASKKMYFDAVHAANSAAILKGYCTELDYVRPGIIMYGYPPCSSAEGRNIDVQPVARLVSHISALKEVKKGTPVSYGARYVAQSDTRIATVPIGYADGYSRSFGGKAHVIVNDTLVPVVGTVCMDQIMLDVGNIPCAVGDEVVLFGDKKNASVSLDELANIRGTITYEILTNISPRVEKIYI